MSCTESARGSRHRDRDLENCSAYVSAFTRTLRVREAFAGLRAVGRVADASGKVANQENDVMAMKLEPAQDAQAHEVADVHVGARGVEPLIDGEPLALRDVVEELVADDGVIEHPPVEERLQVPIFHVDSPRSACQRSGV